MNYLGRFVPDIMAAANHVLGQQGEPIREGAQRELSGLPGWLYRTWQDHHLLYALGVVAFLLALGAAIGIASERALTALGFETEESDNTE